MPAQPAATADRRLVTLRTAVVVAVVASIFAVGAAVGISYAVIGNPAPGPRGHVGPEGPQGEAGPEGPEGSANVSDEDVYSAIESDPSRVAAAVQDDLDPTPSDVQGNVDQVASDLSDLCGTLSQAGALSDEFIICP